MTARAIAASWLATRIAMGRPAHALARGRERLWAQLRPTLARTPALAPFADRELADLPVTDVADLRADYGRWNSLGCSHAALHAAAQDAEAGGAGDVRPGVVAGYSTGSGGTRGLFLASASERSDYIGQILARTLPATDLLRPMRIALLLRANSRLYSDSAGSRRSFLHLPLDMETREACAALERFSPTVLIAPSSRLAGLAELGIALPTLRRVFFGAEPMGEAEREFVRARLGVRPDPIYQATEGFIAAPCRYGALHLNDHSLEIELEPVERTAGFRPIVTDLRRVSQPIVRVRMDDFIEPDPRPCSCGYAGRVIRPVMGRIGERWRWPGRTVTPREVVEAMESLLPPPAAWQAIALGNRVEVRLASPAPAGLAARLKARLELPVPVCISDAAPDAPSPKRRRVLNG